jgi:hypothetical protein
MGVIITESAFVRKGSFYEFRLFEKGRAASRVERRPLAETYNPINGVVAGSLRRCLTPLLPAVASGKGDAVFRAPSFSTPLRLFSPLIIFSLFYMLPVIYNLIHYRCQQ